MRIIKCILLNIIDVIFIFSPSDTNDIYKEWDKGKKFFKRKEYVKAMNVLQNYYDYKGELEDDNVVKELMLGEIKYYLGYMYFYGLGTEVDKERGMLMMKQSAGLGEDRAQLFVYSNQKEI